MENLKFEIGSSSQKLLQRDEKGKEEASSKKKKSGSKRETSKEKPVKRSKLAGVTVEYSGEEGDEIPPKSSDISDFERYWAERNAPAKSGPPPTAPKIEEAEKKPTGQVQKVSLQELISQLKAKEQEALKNFGDREGKRSRDGAKNSKRAAILAWLRTQDKVEGFAVKCVTAMAGYKQYKVVKGKVEYNEGESENAKLFHELRLAATAGIDLMRYEKMSAKEKPNFKADPTPVSSGDLALALADYGGDTMRRYIEALPLLKQSRAMGKLYGLETLKKIFDNTFNFLFMQDEDILKLHKDLPRDYVTIYLPHVGALFETVEMKQISEDGPVIELLKDIALKVGILRKFVILNGLKLTVEWPKSFNYSEIWKINKIFRDVSIAAKRWLTGSSGHQIWTAKSEFTQYHNKYNRAIRRIRLDEGGVAEFAAYLEEKRVLDEALAMIKLRTETKTGDFRYVSWTGKAWKFQRLDNGSFTFGFTVESTTERYPDSAPKAKKEYVEFFEGVKKDFVEKTEIDEEGLKLDGKKEKEGLEKPLEKEIEEFLDKELGDVKIEESADDGDDQSEGDEE